MCAFPKAIGACRNSFSADTDGATAEGAKEIADVAVGDRVLAYDEKTGATGSYPVTDVFSHTDEFIVTLTLDDETLETTADHPFYVLLRGWVEAGELPVGASVRTTDGSYGVVEAVAVVRDPQPMYNLTVADAHTFFVGEGAWLVHNQCAKKSHLNSRGSLEPHHVYEMFETDAAGNISTFKYGISGKPLLPDGMSARLMEQVDGWNALRNGKTYSGRVLVHNVPGRELALRIEQDLVDMYAEMNPAGYFGPPGNKRPKPTPR